MKVTIRRVLTSITKIRHHGWSTQYHHEKSKDGWITLLSAVRSAFTHFTGRRYGIHSCWMVNMFPLHILARLCVLVLGFHVCVHEPITVAWWKLGLCGIHGCSDQSMLDNDEAQLLSVTTTFNWRVKLASTNELSFFLMKYQINACSSHP